MKHLLFAIIFAVLMSQFYGCHQTGKYATTHHVSLQGDDSNKGTLQEPLRTISAAALRAMPGDTIMVYEGIYRERVNPPRGGASDEKRITYMAAPGQQVVITGSEPVKGWQKLDGDTWRLSLPNSFFGGFNPYNDRISGDWFVDNDRAHHTGAVYLNGHWLNEAAAKEDVLAPIAEYPLWFAAVDNENTTLWAQFNGVNPNEEMVEINVRQSIFYPEKTGIDYITVHGFTMRHAATNWAPPTAEQVGLLGTNWSKGWIIENNDISYSKCTGITLGKYGDEFDNTSNNSAEGYVEAILRGAENGWSKEKIGHHIVRNNTISHCEQAGIVGSLGAVFSVISGNTIHDIHTIRLFSGDELSAIKFHGAIDMLISGNHIYRSWRGIWLDWMTQGTRVSHNLLHDNGLGADLNVEVNHGPFVVDNNVFLSGYNRNTFPADVGYSIRDASMGGAYIQNLFAGLVIHLPDKERETPFHKENSTEIAGMATLPGGDSRYYNNIFIGYDGLASYNDATLPMQMDGNVFLKGARASKLENNDLEEIHFDPDIQISFDNESVFLHFNTDRKWTSINSRKLVNTDLLGKAHTTGLPFVQTDGSPFLFDTDYFGNKRDAANPNVGPFEMSESGRQSFKVWPTKY